MLPNAGKRSSVHSCRESYPGGAPLVEDGEGHHHVQREEGDEHRVHEHEGE